MRQRQPGQRHRRRARLPPLIGRRAHPVARRIASRGPSAVQIRCTVMSIPREPPFARSGPSGRYCNPLVHAGGGRRLGLAQVAVDDLLAGLGGRAGPAHLAPGQDHAAVRHGQGPVDELLAQHDRDPRPPGLLEALEDRLGHERRQTERHLVGDDQLGRDGERPGQRQHLLLATRQAPGPLRPALPEHREALDGPVDGRGAVRAAAPGPPPCAGCRSTERPGKMPRPSGM